MKIIPEEEDNTSNLGVVLGNIPDFIFILFYFIFLLFQAGSVSLCSLGWP